MPCAVSTPRFDVRVTDGCMRRNGSRAASIYLSLKATHASSGGGVSEPLPTYEQCQMENRQSGRIPPPLPVTSNGLPYDQQEVLGQWFQAKKQEVLWNQGLVLAHGHEQRHTAEQNLAVGCAGGWMSFPSHSETHGQMNIKGQAGSYCQVTVLMVLEHCGLTREGHLRDVINHNRPSDRRGTLHMAKIRRLDLLHHLPHAHLLAQHAVCATAEVLLSIGLRAVAGPDAQQSTEPFLNQLPGQISALVTDGPAELEVLVKDGHVPVFQDLLHELLHFRNILPALVCKCVLMAWSSSRR